MSQVMTKFLENLAVTTGKIAADAVTDTKIRLSNNAYLRARNAADSADVNIVKINASDAIEFASLPQSATAPTSGNDLTNKTYVDSVASAQKTWGKESKTLAGGDITAQYVDLAQLIISNSLDVMVSGLLQRQGVDYTLSTVGGVTRVTFAGDLATGGNAELIAGDVMLFKYQY